MNRFSNNWAVGFVSLLSWTFSSPYFARGEVEQRGHRELTKTAFPRLQNIEFLERIYFIGLPGK